MNIEQTEWAKEFLSDDPTEYRTALELASNPTLVVFVDRTRDTGEWLWAISVFKCNVKNNIGFWLDAKKTKKEAIALCKKMGWRIEGVPNER